MLQKVRTHYHGRQVGSMGHDRAQLEGERAYVSRNLGGRRRYVCIEAVDREVVLLK